MALSNAERQRLYRQRRNAAAKGENLAERARETVEAALAVLWGIHVAEAGDDMELLYGYSTEDAWRAVFFDGRGSPAEQLRRWIDAYQEDVEPSDAAILARAAELIDAVELTHLRPAAQPKKRRGRQS